MQELVHAIDQFVEDFELAVRETATTDVADFLPPDSHPQFSQIAVELLRVDMEYQFDEKLNVELEDYLRRFPLVFVSDRAVHDLAFEHYRLQLSVNKPVSPRLYEERYGIDTTTWRDATSTLKPRDTDLGSAGSSSADTAIKLLAPGRVFESFVLKEELGRGAMGRVFLATQTGIADRDVVLKFQPGQSVEVRRLGRLQHTNIVPILSAHPFPDGSAICMPFLGKRTLRDIIRSRDQTGIDPLSVAIDLARALCHAHSRDVLHRDIKPANILITDDNRAMLLDFNLAQDAASSSHEVVGGTLAYIAPEQLAGVAGLIESADKRSDIYSLGAVLFELITGRSHGSDFEAVLAGQCTPAMASIVSRCLKRSPDGRYQAAAALLEDLERHSQSLPLLHQTEPSNRERIAKWAKRHPRLSSTATLCFLFAGMLAFGAVAWKSRSDRLEQLESIEQFREFQAEVIEVRSLLALTDPDTGAEHEGLRRGRTLLKSLGELRDYRVPIGLPTADQKEQAIAIGELLFYMSQASQRMAVSASPRERLRLIGDSRQYNTEAQAWLSTHLDSVPRALKAQEASLAGHSDTDIHASPTFNRLDVLLTAIEFNRQRRFNETLALLDGTKTDFPNDVSFWNLLGTAYAGSSQHMRAEMCFTTCVSLKPDSWVAWCNRGLARLATQDFAGAKADFTRVIQLRPNHWSGFLNRAIACGKLRKFQPAIQDLLKGQALGGPTRMYFIRARYRQAIGDHAGSREDRLAGLNARPTDATSWISRGVARIDSDPEGALADFQEAVKMRPTSVTGWRNIAHVLSERLNRSADAIKALTKLIDAEMDDPATYAGRAVLFARQDRREEALADVSKSLRLSRHPRNLYQAACVHTLLMTHGPSHQADAMSLLTRAFSADPSLINRAETDPDLESLVELREFRDVVEAINTVRRVGLESSKADEP